jgi:hypothetical protein
MSSKSFLELYRAHKGYVCDKWEQYLAVYDAEIGQLVARGEPLNLLEIGVQNGGSLEIWAKLLPAGSRIIGIDIDPSCAGLTLPDNVRVLIGDASDAEFLQASLGDQAFDIVIDDGSHRSRDVVHSFRALFPRLRPSGKYFIEDLHASYWREFGGGFRGQDSAVEFLKSLIDALHADHFKDAPNLSADELAALTALNRQIARLCFFDSLAVIEKYPREKAQPFVRTVAGSAVEASTVAWRNYLTSWSTPLMVFDDRVRQVLDAETKQEVARLGGEVARCQAQLAAAEAAAEKLREQLSGTKHALARTSGQVHDVDTKLHEREQELQLAQDALEVERRRRERVRRELTEVRDKRDALRARLKAIKASWSWRLSLPIRTIERLLK